MHSHPKSAYAPIRGTVHHKNSIWTPSLPPRRDFEGVGSGATAFQTSNVGGKAEGRMGMMNNTAKAIRQFRGQKAASFLDLREIEDSEVAGHHHEPRCSTWA